MDFNIKKPTHILAFLMILASIIIIIILPVFSFFSEYLSAESSSVQAIENLSSQAKIIFEIILLITQLSFVIVLMVIFPLLWYVLVNNCSLKEIFSRLKLHLKKIDLAIIWGIIAAIIMFGVNIILNLILLKLGVKSEELGNVQDLETFFSPVSLFILVAAQPICEEIFFRGFLLDKISSFGGDYVAIVITGLLFGLAHLSYGKIFPVITIIIMGFVLAFLVIKTKNLYSAIIAHTCFNVTSFVLYSIASG